MKIFDRKYLNFEPEISYQEENEKFVLYNDLSEIILFYYNIILEK